MKKDKRKSAIKEIKSFFNNPEFMLDEKFLLEFNSEGVISVRGCEDIKHYTDENILIVSEKHYISVSGNDLYMKEFSKNDSVIDGEIESINFIRRRGEK